MAVKRIKVKAGEDLSPENVLRAIEALEKGSTKKVACGMLGIAYNTTRLKTIIETYHDRVAFVKRQKAKRRGTPVLVPEAIMMIEEYLESGSMEQVSKARFRTTALVKETLNKYGALLKAAKTDYFNPMLMPDECMADSLSKGDLVWSSRYNAAAEVDSLVKEGVYRIWVLGTQCQFAMQPIEELGSLKHLEELGVNIKRVVKE